MQPVIVFDSLFFTREKERVVRERVRSLARPFDKVAHSPDVVTETVIETCMANFLILPMRI